MKRITISFFVILIIFCGTFFYFDKSKEDYFEILLIEDNTIYVMGKDSDPDVLDDTHAVYMINDETRLINRNGEEFDFDDLKVGQFVIISQKYMPYTILPSPPRRLADEVIVVK